MSGKLVDLVIIIFILAIVALLCFAVYQGVSAWQTPVTIKNVTIKSIATRGSATYIQGNDCKVYWTYDPIVTVNAKIGETNTYKVKIYDYMILPFQNKETSLMPEIVGETNGCTS
jgi:hypothetical protein